MLANRDRDDCHKETLPDHTGKLNTLPNHTGEAETTTNHAGVTDMPPDCVDEL